MTTTSLVRAVGKLNLNDWTREELESALQAIHRQCLREVESHLEDLGRRPDSEPSRSFLIERQAVVLELRGILGQSWKGNDRMDDFVQARRAKRQKVA